MDNMACTDEYRAYRREQEAVFRQEYLRNEQTLSLSAGYRLKKRSYWGRVGIYGLHTTENELLDETGSVRYTYRNLNDSCEVHTVISHRDGGDYLIFRTDLYGYSVLNLTTMQDFHYIPSGSFPEGETFIWTSVIYNPENNLLVVSGCYWACPCGTMLQDFSHPMAEPTVWVDVQEHLEDGYNRYDDVDFVQWRGTDLVLKAMDCENGETEIVLSEQQYGKWLKEKWK